MAFRVLHGGDRAHDLPGRQTMGLAVHGGPNSIKVVRRMDGLFIACADIGSVPKGNFGWADSEGAEGTKPSELVARVSAVLSAGRAVALGFECPLYVPVQEDELDLGKSRGGEGSRAWSAGAGCGALATGLVQVAWTLGEIRKRCSTSICAYLDWDAFEAAGSGLLIWEAFVSGAGKGRGHAEDAALAVKAFANRPKGPKTELHATNPMSLAGFALMWSGWPVGADALRKHGIAIKA